MKGCGQISMAFETSDGSSESQDWHSYELFPFIALGILGVSAANPIFHDRLKFSTGCIWCVFLQAQLLLEQAHP